MSAEQKRTRFIQSPLGENHIAFRDAPKESSYSEGRVLEVLDGGCGYGRMLHELKIGIPAYAIHTHEEIREGYYRSLSVDIPEDPGLGDAIRTTGITLDQQHAERAESLGLDIDEMIVGSLENHRFDRKFDFILDYTGSAFYFPRRAMPLYRELLQPDGILLVRLMFDYESEISGSPKRVFKSQDIIKENGFHVIINDFFNFVLSLEQKHKDELPIQQWRDK